MTKIVCISDTHGQEQFVNIPKCDILLCAGDYELGFMCDLEILNRLFGEWKNKAKQIVFCMGNHDLFSEELPKESIEKIFTNAIYLENSTVVIGDLKIFGSPYSSIFCDWAYMAHSDKLKKIWTTIPDDTDIIMTHSQPLGINDYVEIGNKNVGCPFLRDRIKEIKPKLYVGGHLHEGHNGYEDEFTIYINASLMDEGYNLVNEPIVIEV